MAIHTTAAPMAPAQAQWKRRQKAGDRFPLGGRFPSRFP
jgi:hypothetical protein